MIDEQEVLPGAHRAHGPTPSAPDTVLAGVRSADATAYLDGLDAAGREEARHILRDALIESELSGNFTAPDLMSAYERLGGSDDDLDDVVLTAAAVRHEASALSQAGLAVVWARLIRVQDRLTEGEVRSWLSHDMIRGLAAKAATWTRFSATLLADWARQGSTRPQEDALAGFLVERHPEESAAVLAQAFREQPAQAGHLLRRVQDSSPKTVTRLTAALVDDASIPASFRIHLAATGDEAVRTRARAMVARELGVDEQALSRLAPDAAEVPSRASDDETPPAVQRLAWNIAAVAFLVGSVLGLGFRAALFFALVLATIGYLVGREDESDA